jgi:tRNA modification GTPase
MPNQLEAEMNELKSNYPKASILLVCNKSDLLTETALDKKYESISFIKVSAKNKQYIERIHHALHQYVQQRHIDFHNTIVTNIRHVEALNQTLDALSHVKNGLQTGLSADLLAVQLRSAIYYLGSITGQIATDDLLKNIFERFCIGK